MFNNCEFNSISINNINLSCIYNLYIRRNYMHFEQYYYEPIGAYNRYTVVCAKIEEISSYWANNTRSLMVGTTPSAHYKDFKFLVYTPGMEDGTSPIFINSSTYGKHWILRFPVPRKKLKFFYNQTIIEV